MSTPSRCHCTLKPLDWSTCTVKLALVPSATVTLRGWLTSNGSRLSALTVRPGEVRLPEALLTFTVNTAPTSETESQR